MTLRRRVATRPCRAVPDLVREEVEGFLPACHTVRAFLAAAARDEDWDPDDPSFVHAVRVVCPRCRSLTVRIRDLCRKIREERIVSCGGLHRPRGGRRKMNNYPIRRSGPLDPRHHAWMPLILAPAC